MWRTESPYEKGLPLSFRSRVASEDPTWSPSVDQAYVVDDFDLTLVDLGSDVQGLQEGGLCGLHVSGTLAHDHIVRAMMPALAGAPTWRNT